MAACWDICKSRYAISSTVVLKTIYACFDDLGKGLDVPLGQQQCQRELALLARLQDSLCSLTAACWDIHKSRYTHSSTVVGADRWACFDIVDKGLDLTCDRKGIQDICGCKRGCRLAFPVSGLHVGILSRIHANSCNHHL